jgi:hypothetical protein
VIVAQKTYVKIQSATTQARLKSQRHQIFRETEEKTSKPGEEEEQAIRSWEGRVYRCMEVSSNVVLKRKTNIEIQAINQIQRGAHERLQGTPKVQNVDEHLRTETPRKSRRASSLNNHAVKRPFL